MFFPLATVLVITSLTIAGFTRTAVAQSVDSGQFVYGNAGTAPNADSDNVPGVMMQSPTYAGTGCPQGSASATLSPDGKTLSVIFDSYVVEASGSSLARAEKGCQINIPLSVPPGYAVQVVKMDYRGFTSLPQGARSTFGAGFRLLEINGRETNARRVMRANVMLGPKQEDFMLSSVIQGPEFSPCGQNFVLAAESAVNVQSNRGGEQTISTVDSLDGKLTPVVYSLRWKQCQPGRVDRPNLPSLPGGPPFSRPGRPGMPGRR